MYIDIRGRGLMGLGHGGPRVYRIELLIPISILYVIGYAKYMDCGVGENTFSTLIEASFNRKGICYVVLFYCI